MLLSPQITGRRGPQRSGEYRLRRGGVSEGLVASYTFDDGTGTTLHDRRGWWPRFVSDVVEVSDAAADVTVLNGTYYPTGENSGTIWRKSDLSGCIFWYGDENGQAWYITEALAAGPDGASYIGTGVGVNRISPLSATSWTRQGSTDSVTVAKTALNQVVSAPLDGTLTGFTQDYSILVSGGGFSNTEFVPNGTEYGKTKYLSPDGNTKLSYWYMMDPEMDGAWYIWAATASDPWMDDYLSTKAGTGDAWGGTYSSSYTVAQGDLQPGPWFEDGLEFSGGYVDFGDVGNAVQPGTGDVTLLFDWTNKGTGTTALFNWSTPWPPAPRIALWGTPGTDLYLSIDNPSGVEVQTTFANSAALWATLNTPRAIAVSIKRAGYAKLFIDGKFISQIGISSITGDLSGMSLCRLGGNWNATPIWRPQARFRRFEIVNRALTADEACAWTANPWRVFSQPRLPLMAFTAGGGTTYSGYYYRYLTSLWSEG